MKNIIVALVLIAQVANAYAYVSNDQIKLPENYKVKGSFSGELNGTDSFHIIVAQNKDQRDFDLFLYAFTANKVEYLTKVTYEKQPSIVSFHSTSNVLTLIVSYENNRKDFYNVLDVNLSNGEVQKSNDLLNENVLATFRDKEVTILLNGSKKEMTATIINSSNAMKKISTTNFNKKIYDKYFNGSVDEINQNEYVKNGSINAVKGYHQGDKLIFTKDSKEFVGSKSRHYTSTLTFDLITGSVIEEIISNASYDNVREYESYLLENVLVQFIGNKKEGWIKVYDTKSIKQLQNYDLLTIDLNKITTGKDFISIEDFLKESGKKKHVITLTLNKTKSSNFLVRLDYVLNTYNYNYNWWWWHQHMFMMHQNQMMMQNSIPTGFGPDDFSNYLHYLSYEGTNNYSIQFVIDNNGEIVNEPVANTRYKPIDKKKYVDELNDNKTYKHSSSCFVDGIFRYIAYNKKNRSFTVFNKVLK